MNFNDKRQVQWVVQQVKAGATNEQIKKGAAKLGFHAHNNTICLFRNLGPLALESALAGGIQQEYSILKDQIAALADRGVSADEILDKLKSVTKATPTRDLVARVIRQAGKQQPKRRASKPAKKQAKTPVRKPSNGLDASVRALLIELATEMRVSNVRRLVLTSDGKVKTQIESNQDRL